MPEYKSRQEEAQLIIEELERNDDAINPEVAHEPIGGIDITVLYDSQILPAGFCKFVGQYADLRVECVRGYTDREDRLELTIQV